MFNDLKKRERTTTCTFSTSIRLLSTSEARYIKNKILYISHLVILSYFLLSYFAYLRVEVVALSLLSRFQ